MENKKSFSLRKLWHPAYLAVLFYMLIGVLNICVTSYAWTLFVNPMMEAMNCSSALFQLRNVASGGSSVLILSMVRKLYKKYDHRLLALIGTISYALVFVGYSFCTNVYAYIALGLLQGFGQAICGWMVGPMMIYKWFDKGSATAIQLANAGQAFIATFTTPFIQSLITQYGWQFALRAACIGAAAIGVLAIVVLGGLSPDGMGVKPFGFSEKKVENASETVRRGVPYEKAKKSGIVVMMTLIVFLGTVGGRINVFFSPLAIEAGYTAEEAARIVSYYSLGSTFIPWLTALLCDVIGLKKYCKIFLPGTVAIHTLLLFASSKSGSFTLMCMAYSVMGIAGYNMIRTVGPKLFFGGADLAAYTAAANIGANLAVMFGSVIIGFIYDVAGSYHNAIYFTIACSVAVMILGFLVIKKAESLEWEDIEVPATK